MKTPQQWFDAYSISHQNITNQKIHYFCVPIIYFSIIGLLMSIPATFLQETLDLKLALIENWASIVSIFILLFYLRLNLKIFIRMFIFTALCISINYGINAYFNLLLISIVLFVIAWIGQFYGHKLEGKKPSFLEDIQFLLIGPAWVFQKLLK